MDERVLLVEDDPSIREIASLGLSQAGFKVTTAADGREGLLQFRQAPFDVVVLDVMLPELDGLDVCRAIRRESQVPVVFLSARSDTVDVTKPFELPELVARIRAVLGRATEARGPEVIAVGDLEIDADPLHPPPARYRIVTRRRRRCFGGRAA